MLIGVPTEIKNDEFRVGLTPLGVQELILEGHQVIVQSNAGIGCNFTDDDYENAGAEIVKTAQDIFTNAKMIIKVKEPLAQERKMLHSEQILFAYLHLAADQEQAYELQESKAICIAFETVTDDFGRLPLLAPMSEIAGRMSIQAAASCLEKAKGGRGTLIGGVPGVEPAHIVILGGGVVGFNAAQMAMGLGGNVTVIDKNITTLRTVSEHFNNRINTIYSTQAAIDHYIQQADAVIGAVLIAGDKAPSLITKDMLSEMKPRATLVDVSIDQGGCFETSRPTTHSDPTYIVDNIIHYCVANMPGAVPLTSAKALENATLPYTLTLASEGWKEAMKHNAHLRNGLNIFQGKVYHQAVANALNIPLSPIDDIFF